MSVFFSPCTDCKWFIGAVDKDYTLCCKAFPDGIPKEVFLSIEREGACSNEFGFEEE